jgi:hypothetical protein
MRFFTLILLLTVYSFANEYKRIAIIPSNINYTKESAEEFSEILYDSVANAVAEYNFAQKVPQNMYQLRGPLLAQKKYQTEIRNAHRVIKSKPFEFMKKHKLDKLLVMDFNTNRVIHMMNRCKKLCNVKISFIAYTIGKKPFSKTLTYQYNGESCLLSDKSTDSLNRSISHYLSK